MNTCQSCAREIVATAEIVAGYCARVECESARLGQHDTPEEKAFRTAALYCDLDYEYADDGRAYREGKASVAHALGLGESLGDPARAATIWNETMLVRSAPSIRTAQDFTPRVAQYVAPLPWRPTHMGYRFEG